MQISSRLSQFNVEKKVESLRSGRAKKLANEAKLLANEAV